MKNAVWYFFHMDFCSCFWWNRVDRMKYWQKLWRPSHFYSDLCFWISEGGRLARDHRSTRILLWFFMSHSRWLGCWLYQSDYWFIFCVSWVLPSWWKTVCWFLSRGSVWVRGYSWRKYIKLCRNNKPNLLILIHFKCRVKHYFYKCCIIMRWVISYTVVFDFEEEFEY